MELLLGEANPQDARREDGDRAPGTHRTIDRVTQILEQVAYNPGVTFAQLSRAIDAPKSSVHGFIRGLLSTGWLHQDEARFYLGPALYGLTLASGHLRTGAVTDADLRALRDAVDVTVFLGVLAGENLIYVSEVGAEMLAGFGARTNIRRQLLDTAGGKALLADMPIQDCNSYLRRRGPAEAHLVEAFLSEYDDIKRDRIACNTLHSGSRFALATVVRGATGGAVAEVTLVGRSAVMVPRIRELSGLLLDHVDRWASRR